MTGEDSHLEAAYEDRFTVEDDDNEEFLDAYMEDDQWDC